MSSDHGAHLELQLLILAGLLFFHLQPPLTSQHTSSRTISGHRGVHITETPLESVELSFTMCESVDENSSNEPTTMTRARKR
jgi:hypothetical protein